MPLGFTDRVKSTIKKYNLLQNGDRVLVGLSGGVDSVVLLHTLLALKVGYSLELYVAHLDHMFRGEESRGDRRFCEAMTERLNLDIVCGEIDCPKIAKEKGISLEEAARFERYDFFRRTARVKGTEKIAIAHNEDDQAETVLMRAIRGTGIAGLGGMAPLKKMRGFTVIRPLIEISRKEIEDFMRDNNLGFRHDPSNDKLIFTRNKIRHELIPYLEKNFNPNIKEVLANMAENLRPENEFLDKFSKRKYRAISKRNKDGEIVIEIKKIKRQAEAIRKRILRNALEELKGDLRRFTYQHWREMEELLNNRPLNSIVDLPGGFKVIKRKKTLIMEGPKRT